MGLFDKVFGSRDSSKAEIQPEESIAAIMLATIAADGHISDSEVAGFVAAANRLKMYQKMSGPEFKRIVDRLFGLLNRHGAQQLLQMSTGAIPADLVSTTFAICVDLVLADGNLDPEEEAIIEQLQAALKIPDALATKILEVMLVKNKA